MPDTRKPAQETKAPDARTRKPPLAKRAPALEQILGGTAHAPAPLSPVPSYDMPEAGQEFIKVALHSEKLKFGRKPQGTQMDVFELLDGGAGKSLAAREQDKADARDHGLTVIGLDYSLAQSKALHAIQTLLYHTNYEGNMPQRHIQDGNNVFAFTGTLPVLRFAVPEYLDAYGVTKYETKRGKQEYASAERAEALHALADLAKPVIMVYDRRRRNDANGNPVYDAIRTVRPLLNITEGFRDLTQSELEGVRAGGGPSERLTQIVVEPSVVLVDQINKYFVLKPANLYQELRIKFGKIDKKLALFIEYLLAKAAEKARGKHPLHFKLKLETIAYGLRMDALINSRQSKRIVTLITDYFAKARALGYVGEYHFSEAASPLAAVAEFTLIPGKVYYPRALRELTQLSEALATGTAQDAQEPSEGQLDIMDMVEEE